jgi:hypothetical protein
MLFFQLSSMEVPSNKCYGTLSRVSHDDERGRADRWTDVTKSIITFRDYAKANK